MSISEEARTQAAGESRALAFMAGAAAFREGAPEASCPHPEGLDDGGRRWEWRMGWAVAASAEPVDVDEVLRRALGHPVPEPSIDVDDLTRILRGFVYPDVLTDQERMRSARRAALAALAVLEAEGARHRTEPRARRA